MPNAGEFEVDVTDPHPCWVHISRRGERKLTLTHRELRDLQFCIERAIAEAERKLGPIYKDEVK